MVSRSVVGAHALESVKHGSQPIKPKVARRALIGCAGFLPTSYQLVKHRNIKALVGNGYVLYKMSPSSVRT